MGRRAQTDVEKDLVKLAMALLVEDWPQTQSEPPTAAAIGERVWNRRESTNVSRYILGGELPKEVRAVRKISARSAAIFQQWIPSLNRRNSLDNLRDVFAHALEELGIPAAEIEYVRACTAAHWPGAFRRTPKAEPLARFTADLNHLRRLSDEGRGPINLALSQSWYLALSLVEAVAAEPKLVAIAPRVWEAICNDFVPNLDKALRFGEPEDSRGSGAKRLSDEERSFHHFALRDCVAAVTLRGEDPAWMPLRLREEFRVARLRIHRSPTPVRA